MSKGVAVKGECVADQLGRAIYINHTQENENRLLRDVVDRSALSTIFFLPGSQYAAYSEECQRLHYYEAANITECKVTHPPTEMADIQGKPDPAAKEIINRLLAETGQASRYSTDVPDELWELMVPFFGSTCAHKIWWFPSNSTADND